MSKHSASIAEAAPTPAVLTDRFHDSAHYEQQLGLCHGYFRIQRGKRRGPAFVRIGRAVRYGEQAVAAWLAAQQGGAA